jgi:hypothetical protein
MSKSEHVKLWRKKTKARLVKALGGKCNICGYDKCSNALEFHHLNPNEKDFNFGKIRANPKSWNKIVAEVKKCVLLCSNCHREVHDNLATIVLENIPVIDPTLEDYKKFELEKSTLQKEKICSICGTKYYSGYATCSNICAHKIRYKINWDEIDLPSLWPEQSMVAIGKQLGVTDSSVRKRLIKLGLLTQQTNPPVGPPPLFTRK